MATAERTWMPVDVIELLDSSEDSGVSRRRGEQPARDLAAIELLDSSEEPARDLAAIELLDSSEESGRGRGRSRGKQPIVDLDLSVEVKKNGLHVASSSGAETGHQESKSLDKAVSDLLHLFPLLCPKVAASLLYPLMEHATASKAVQQAIDYVLENGIHETAFVHASEGAAGNSASKKSDKHDMGAQTSQAAGAAYEEICLDHLAAQFPRVRRPDLRDAWASHGSRLGSTYRAIQTEYENAISEDGSGVKTTGSVRKRSWLPNGRLNLLRNPRAISRTSPRQECPQFRDEWAALQLELAEELRTKGGEEGSDQRGEEDVGQPVSQEIECGCCCCDFPFEEMVQCADGHLFCFRCLRRRVEESIFGGVKACGSLPCMETNGCTESFPFSEIKRALPEDVLSKYEQRQAEDALARAKLQGLVYCPFCNSPWEVEPDMQVLNCPNECCRKASCILCKEPDHLPLRCNEVEKKTETSKRRVIEELMSKAVIRVCSVCKAELVKSEGCNKVMCRCGQAMCYVCRKPIKSNYDHFCQHAREPNRLCAMCSKCGLWEQEEDDKVVNEAKEAALKQIAQDEPGILKRAIGPTANDAASKRPKGEAWHGAHHHGHGAHHHARARWVGHHFAPAAPVAQGHLQRHAVHHPRAVAPVMGHMPVLGAVAHNRPILENIAPVILRDPLGRPLGRHHGQLVREGVDAPQGGQAPHLPVFRFGVDPMREVGIGWD